MFLLKNKKNNKNKNKGFSLIELMIVIAIIGLLASIVMISLDKTKSKARDTKRVAEAKSVEQALHLYSLDHGGKYPYSALSASYFKDKTPQEICIDNSIKADLQNVFTELVDGKYLSQIPKNDEGLNKLGYCYIYISEAEILAHKKLYIAGYFHDNIQSHSQSTKPIHIATSGIKMYSKAAIFGFVSEVIKTVQGDSAFFMISTGNISQTSEIKNIVPNVNLTSGETQNVKSTFKEIVNNDIVNDNNDPIDNDTNVDEDNNTDDNTNADDDTNTEDEEIGDDYINDEENTDDSTGDEDINTDDVGDDSNDGDDTPSCLVNEIWNDYLNKCECKMGYFRHPARKTCEEMTRPIR